MRISDWSSDVCSSDLRCLVVRVEREEFGGQLIAREDVDIFEPPVEPHLEQRDRDLARIGRRPAIQRDHLIKSPVRASVSERSEEHTSELQSLMRNSYAVFCLKKKTYNNPRQELLNYHTKQKYQ